VLTSEPVFAVDHRRFGGRAVVSVSGELDIATEPQFAAVIALALGGRPAELWVDLTATSFIDSSGLNLLRTAEERFDGPLVVVCPRHVRRVFEIAGLTRVMTLRDAPLGVETNGSSRRENSQPAG
jgi:anti-sigma B factor antagonist